MAPTGLEPHETETNMLAPASTRRSHLLHRTRSVFLLCILAGVAAGCTRAPLDPVCPALGPGDLAVSEIRGEQTGTDTWGQWIELYNTTGAACDLAGLIIHLEKLDGSGQADILVRRTIRVEAGGYAVLGRFPAERVPAHVDYGFEYDFGSSLYAGGLVALHACDTLVDDVIYRDLPREGSWSFDGARTPDATANDEQEAWCTDDQPWEPGDGGTTEVGLPGSPGERNRACQ